MSQDNSVLVQTAGGIFLPERVKLMCCFCGAAYERRVGETEEKATEGLRAHELQCRLMTRGRFIQAALSGPVAMKGGEAVIDTVEQALTALETGARATWKD